MKSRWVGLVGVVVLAFGIIGYKEVLSPRRAVGPVGAPSENPRVILVADPKEAKSQCGCGEVIRAVRAARSNGVPVQELPPNSESELLKCYRILTAPTVLFLDADGREVARYEGEDGKTVEAIRSRLLGMTEWSRP